MTFRVRSAEERDVPFLAGVMHESMTPLTGRGVFDEALAETGTGPLEFHEVLLRTRSNNWAQLDSFLILDGPDGEPAGAAGAFSGDLDDLRPLTAQGLETAASQLNWSESVSRTFWRKYISLFGLFGKTRQLTHAASYVIEYAAVSPEMRGHGAYGLILAGHRDRARALGFDAISTSAAFGNQPVLRALQKFGFEEAMRFGPEEYRDMFPGMIRLLYRIPPLQRCAD